MRKTVSTVSMLIVLIGGVTVANALAQGRSQTASEPSGVERHPKIHQAITALQNARGDLQNAAHDFCGHRVEALEATNNAIKQLQLALESDRASLPPRENPAFELAGYARSLGGNDRSAESAKAVGKATGGERHPMLRRAINALEAAKVDLQNAATDFHGHRVEALESVNNALRQLQAALACDKD